MKSNIYITPHPKDYERIPWQQADTGMYAKIKLHIARQVLPRLLMVIFGFTVVGGFSAMFIWVAFFAPEGTDTSAKIFISIFLLVLDGLLIGGLLYMAHSEKQDTGLGIANLFARNVEMASGPCIASYVKETNEIRRETAKYSDFQLGTYKATRCFAEEIPVGAEYVFVKPLKPSENILFFPLIPLKKYRKVLASQNDYLPKRKKIKKSNAKGNVEDFDSIGWTKADEPVAERLRSLVNSKKIPTLIFQSVILFGIMCFPLSLFIFFVKIMIEEATLGPIVFLCLLLPFPLFLGAGFVMQLRSVLQTRKLMLADELYITTGTCTEYITRHRRRSDVYDAIFAVGKIKVELSMIPEKEYNNLKIGTEYIFVKPARPNGFWIGFHKDSIQRGN